MPRWHGSVSYTLTGRDGIYCGRVGLAYPCDSQEDGWAKGVAWLKESVESCYPWLVRTFELDVRFF